MVLHFGFLENVNGALSVECVCGYVVNPNDPRMSSFNKTRAAPTLSSAAVTTTSASGGNGMSDSMSFLGLSLTLPAYVVLIAGLVLVVLQTIFMLSRAKRTKTMPHILVINVALMLLLVALNVYIINCLSIGRCDVLAVIITALYLLAVVNALIYFLTNHGGFLGLKSKRS
jgi:hypothetical protein